jgi:hypothetical protein
MITDQTILRPGLKGNPEKHVTKSTQSLTYPETNH